ncbi:hypothetical protein H2203_003746 [Taxawa tesnikishii (nom. ined.)]|nr:hypothetical protein H2203_003746 [Dothideales sp. JES 119]
MSRNVAIAGATGHLGQHLTNILLSPTYRSSFASIIVLTRQDPKSSQLLSKWQSSGAQIRSYDSDNMASSLSGIDVLINAIGSTGHDMKDKIASALPSTDVKIYLPSEFGVDHTVHDFPLPEWDYKKSHAAGVYCGLFMEDSIAHWFGFGVPEKGRYESVGGKETPVAFTSLDDVGRAVAVLCAMPAEDVPEEVHLAGDNVSMAGIAALMEAAGGGEIGVEEVELQPYKERFVKSGEKKPSHYLRFLMGEGKIDHSGNGMLSNENDVVNPGETKWKWKTMKDWATETHGTGTL